MKYLATDLLNTKKINLKEKFGDFQKKCSSETYDIVVLYGIVCEKIEAYNSKIQARQTRIKNMKYSDKYFASDLFDGLDIDRQKIDDMIEKYPEKTDYEIYWEFIRKSW